MSELAEVRTGVPGQCPVDHEGGLRAFPFDRADPMDLPPEYAEVRRDDPVTEVVLPSGDRAWLVTRYDDVKAVLSDRRFSRDLNRPGVARMSTKIGFGNYGNPFADPPVHTRWRRQVAKAFTPRQVEGMRPQITRIVDELLDTMGQHGAPLDLMSWFAYPLPITVISQMLGVPVADQGKFRGWVDVMLAGEHNSAERAEAASQLMAYAGELGGIKRESPADDLLSGLVAVTGENDGRLTEQELLITVMTLLVAGYKTTAAEIGKGLLTLLRHPEQLAALRADPALFESAADELLRTTPPGNGLGISRYATVAIEVGGVTIPAGSTVLVARHAANRDEAHFPDPERFDPLRADANQHLTFGSGPAYCFGAPVARMELQVGFERLFRRFPGLRLAGSYDDIPWREDLAAHVPGALMVSWGEEAGGGPGAGHDKSVG
jgi:cytochrome P450